jgi:hypothetical protein
MHTDPTDPRCRSAATGTAPDQNLDTATLEGIATAAILCLLLSPDYHGPWTRDELQRELSSPPLAVTDALADLAGAGLIHLHGELVFASRAARRMDRLSL